MPMDRWPCRPDSFTDIMGEDIMRFAQSALAVVCGMPTTIIEQTPDGLRRVDADHKRFNYSKFCLAYRGDPDDHTQPGMPQGEQGCLDNDLERAEAVLDDDDLAFGDVISRPCHCGLVDYLIKVELDTAKAVVFTGQRRPLEGLRDVREAVLRLSGEGGLNEEQAIQLLVYADELQPVDPTALDRLKVDVDRFMALVRSRHGQRKQELEHRVLNELMVLVGGEESPSPAVPDWGQYQEGLKRLVEFLGVAWAIVFAGDEESSNVLPGKAAWDSRTPDAADVLMPHFNWNKSRIEGEQQLLTGDDARRVATNGVKGAGDVRYQGAWCVASHRSGQLKAVLLLGPTEREVEPKDNKEFLNTLTQMFLNHVASTVLASRLDLQRRRNADSRDFLAHQVRSRMMNIESAAQGLLEATAPPSPDRKKFGDEIETLHRIHAELSEVSDIASRKGFSLTDRGQLDWQRVQLDTVIEQAIDNEAAFARKREVQVLTDDLLLLPPIQGDAIRLRWLFQALINNAIKYSRAPSISGRVVRIRGHAGEATVRVEIESFGLGVLDADRERMFEKRVRLAAADALHTRFSEVPGLGLGLYEARQTVVMHRGRIWATSRHHSGDPVSPTNLDECLTTLNVELSIKRRSAEEELRVPHNLGRG